MNDARRMFKAKWQANMLILLLVVVVFVRYLDAKARPIFFLDESAYLARGVAIVEEGKVPPLSLSPGVSLVHALSYMFLRQNPMGMDLSGRVTAFLGGFILYGMFYLAISRALGPQWGMVAVGMGLLYLPVYTLDGNSSDLLYAVMLSVLLVLLTGMEEIRILSWRMVTCLSFSTAIATLMRNDGLVIFVGLTLALWLHVRRPFEHLLYRTLKFTIHWLAPFAGIILVMGLLSWKTTGTFEILPEARTYTAFEQGAGLVRRFDLVEEGRNPWIEGGRIAAEIYGSREENRGSALLALIRHPRAWLRRVVWNLRDFFLRWFEAHNGRLSTVTLLLSLMGWIGIFARRKVFLAASIGALLLPTAAYFFLTFWRGGYVVMYSPLILYLNVYALATLAESPLQFSRKGKILVGTSIAILGISLVGIVAWHSEYIYGYKGLIEGGIGLSEILGGIAIWIFIMRWLLASDWASYGIWGTISVAFILGIWLANSGDIFTLALSDKTQARREAQLESQKSLRDYIYFSFEHLRGTRVCTHDPSLPWYARQQPVVLYELFDPSMRRNVMALIRLMADRDCEYLLWRWGNLDLEGVLEPVFSEDGITLLKLKGTSLKEGEEIVLEDFEEGTTESWSAFGWNNVEGEFRASKGVLILAYENNLTQKDVYAYIFTPREPVAAVSVIKMRVRVSSGTRLTVDVIRNGELVSPRFLNYYPGTGDWEEIIIPVGGVLNSLTIGIGESGEGSTTPAYRVEIDWIKAIVGQ